MDMLVKLKRDEQASVDEKILLRSSRESSVAQ